MKKIEKKIYGNIENLKKNAISYIQFNGYEKRVVDEYGIEHGTRANYIKDVLEEGTYINPCGPVLYNMVDDYINNLSGDYGYSIKESWNKPYIEVWDLSYILSGIASFFKEEEKRMAREQKVRECKSTWQGIPGDKIEFIIAEVKLLYTSEGYGYNSDPIGTFEITDTNGNIYIYKTANDFRWDPTDNDDTWYLGKKMRGTVKSLDNYKGIYQTRITRCKVVE